MRSNSERFRERAGRAFKSEDRGRTSAVSLAAVANALDGYNHDRILDCVDHSIGSDPDAERIIASDKLPTAFWSRVVRQSVNRTQDTTLHRSIESANVLVGRTAKTNGVLRHSP